MDLLWIVSMRWGGGALPKEEALHATVVMRYYLDDNVIGDHELLFLYYYYIDKDPHQSKGHLYFARRHVPRDWDADAFQFQWFVESTRNLEEC